MITYGDHISSQGSPGETAPCGQEHFVEAQLLFSVQTPQFTVSLSPCFFICHEVKLSTPCDVISRERGEDLH